jgi:hypothetical protein
LVIIGLIILYFIDGPDPSGGILLCFSLTYNAVFAKVNHHLPALRGAVLAIIDAGRVTS